MYRHLCPNQTLCLAHLILSEMQRVPNENIDVNATVNTTETLVEALEEEENLQIPEEVIGKVLFHILNRNMPLVRNINNSHNIGKAKIVVVKDQDNKDHKKMNDLYLIMNR